VEEYKKEQEQKQAQIKQQILKEKEDETNQFYENDEVVVKVYTPAGEKTYEGTLVQWWGQGVTIKTDSNRTLLAIASQNYTVEKSISR
jgi:hypothetical protein